MGYIFREFDTYAVWYMSAKVTGKDGKEYSKAHPTISLSFGDKYIGILQFYDEIPVPKNFVYPDKIPAIRYHISQFSDIMDILRNEKPLQFYLNTDNWSGAVTTVAEPVGEEESSLPFLWNFK